MKNRVIVEIQNSGCLPVQQVYYNTLAYSGREAIANIFFYGQITNPTLLAYVSKEALASDQKKNLETQASSIQLYQGNTFLYTIGKHLTLSVMNVITEDKDNPKNQPKIEPKSIENKTISILTFKTKFESPSYYPIRSALLALQYNDKIHPYNYIDLNLDLGFQDANSENTTKAADNFAIFTWELNF